MPPYVDYAVRGQGEDTLVELLDALAGAAHPKPLRTIGGLTWRRDGQVVHNQDRGILGCQSRPHAAV